jgi:hypothetical protein
MHYLQGFAAVSVVTMLSACAPVQQKTSDQTLAMVTPRTAGVSSVANQGSAAVNAAAGMLGQSGDQVLVNSLVGKLGISPQQALGGVGSIFSVAQQRLNPGDFSKLSQSVPGMNQYLSAVPQQAASSASSSLLGVAGNMMGGQVGGLANLAGSFQSLGMNPSMVSEFVPVVLQYVQNQSGAGAMSLLQHALY